MTVKFSHIYAFTSQKEEKKGKKRNKEDKKKDCTVTLKQIHGWISIMTSSAVFSSVIDVFGGT